MEKKFILNVVSFYYNEKLSRIQSLILSEFIELGSDELIISKEKKHFVALKHKISYETISNIVSLFSRLKITERILKENNRTIYKLVDANFINSIVNKEINEKFDNKF